MSLYRQATGRGAGAMAAAALVALLAGGVGGFALGRGTADEPSLAEQAGEAREGLRPATGALELVTIEYPEAVQGRRVVAETEYSAARAQAQTAADVLAAAREELEALDPAGLGEAEAAVAEVVELVEAQAPAGRVVAAARDASAAVERLAGEAD
jgi:hypothetical protein